MGLCPVDVYRIAVYAQNIYFIFEIVPALACDYFFLNFQAKGINEKWNIIYAADKENKLKLDPDKMQHIKSVKSNEKNKTSEISNLQTNNISTISYFEKNSQKLDTINKPDFAWLD